MSATTLHLAVQYATDLDVPTRAQVRRWVRTAVALAKRGRPGLETIAGATLTIRFVEVDEGRALNRTFRGKDYATNVLTFPYEAARCQIEADLVICMPVVVAEALAQHKGVWSHCAHLVVHGTLHACGYDHEATTDADAMEGLEIGRAHV